MTAESESRGASTLTDDLSGVYAVVDSRIYLCPIEDGIDEVRYTLTITAENRTARPIPLRNPYFVLVGKAAGVEAHDDRGDLKPYISKGRLIVDFTDRPPILPAARYSWTVSYKRSAEVYNNIEDELRYHHTISPQHEFQNIPVTNHRFQCKFIFEKPSFRKWPELKSYRVRQRNTASVLGKPHQEAGATMYTFESFDIGHGDKPMRIDFVCKYRWSRKVIGFGAAAIVALGTVLRKAIVEAIFRWWK